MRRHRLGSRSPCGVYNYSADACYNNGVSTYTAEVVKPNAKERRYMNCTIEGCPGQYEDRRITHTLRRDGRVVVIDQVPAEVCAVCGDVLLAPETIRHIERMLETAQEPDRNVPLYEYV